MKNEYAKPYSIAPEIDPLSDAHPIAQRGVHSGMTIEQIHEIGAERFGSAWYGANRVATEAFQNCGADHTGMRIAKALSLAVFRVLEPFAKPNA
jgi:hypothetical protein